MALCFCITFALAMDIAWYNADEKGNDLVAGSLSERISRE
jgi:hypothetical protein